MMVDLAGKTVVVLASGPSLTDEQIALVKRSGLITIAVNTTWEKARFCRVIWAGDFGWWKYNSDKIDISAERWCDNENAKKYGCRAHARAMKQVSNSGLLAVEWACASGAAIVIMVGFDASIEDGIHHHGPHDETPNPTEARCLKWIDQARRLRNFHSKKKIINCSTKTKIDAFPKRNLTDVLCSLNVI